MAGAYQTSGESARRGTNIWPDSGGGWMNGRGDDTQTMFVGYGHIADFFTGFDWWKTNPHDELVNSGNYCLADPGNLYVVYLPHAGKVTVKLEPGTIAGSGSTPPAGKESRLLKTQPAHPGVRPARRTTPVGPIPTIGRFCSKNDDA